MRTEADPWISPRTGEGSASMPSKTAKLQRGDLVKLKEPYRGRFGFGIVVEILTHCRDKEGSHPRNVSLHLYDEQGQLYIEPSYVAKGLMVPSYVDFHVSELVWYRRAADSGYGTIHNPPDWNHARYLR